MQPPPPFSPPPPGQFPQGQFPPGQWGPPPPFGGPGFPPADPTRSTANWALGLSIAGLCLCCAPLGLVGGFLGFRAMQIAKRTGLPTPGRAIASMVLGGIACVVMTAALISGQIDRKKHDAREAEVTKSLSGKLDGPTLDRDVACALLEKQLLLGLYDNQTSVTEVKCTGAYESNGDRATLRGVNIKVLSSEKTLTGCFAKGSRWFALSAFDGAGACPTAALPPTPARSGKPSEADLAADEEAARKGVVERENAARLEQYTSALVKARDALRTAQGGDKACPAVDVDAILGPGREDKRLLVPAIDFDFLDAPPDKRETKEDWGFLTNDKFKRILDSKHEVKSRAEALAELTKDSGQYLVVYKSETRDWPSVIKKKGILSDDFGYIGGDFDGTLYVVDTKTAAVVCSAPLKFHNDAEVSVRGRHTDDKDVESSLKTNLQSKFEDSASSTIKQMAGGKMRLGYKFLE